MTTPWLPRLVSVAHGMHPVLSMALAQMCEDGAGDGDGSEYDTDDEDGEGNDESYGSTGGGAGGAGTPCDVSRFVVVYHAPCPDGIFAALAAYCFFSNALCVRAATGDPGALQMCRACRTANVPAAPLSAQLLAPSVFFVPFDVSAGKAWTQKLCKCLLPHDCVLFLDCSGPSPIFGQSLGTSGSSTSSRSTRASSMQSPTSPGSPRSPNSLSPGARSPRAPWIAQWALLDVAARVSCVVVLDHHKTTVIALDAFASQPFYGTVPGSVLRTRIMPFVPMGMSGAALSYAFFEAISHRACNEMGIVCRFGGVPLWRASLCNCVASGPVVSKQVSRAIARHGQLAERVERHVNYVEDGDLWRWALAPASREFSAGLTALGLELNTDRDPLIFDKLLDLDTDYLREVGRVKLVETEALCRSIATSCIRFRIPACGRRSHASAKRDGVLVLVKDATHRSIVGSYLAENVVSVLGDHQGLKNEAMSKVAAGRVVAPIAGVAYWHTPPLSMSQSSLTLIADTGAGHEDGQVRSVAPEYDDRRIKVSFRSVGHEPISDVCSVALYLGGGGHYNAASAFVPVSILRQWTYDKAAFDTMLRTLAAYDT